MWAEGVCGSEPECHHRKWGGGLSEPGKIPFSVTEIELLTLARWGTEQVRLLEAPEEEGNLGKVIKLLENTPKNGLMSLLSDNCGL